MRDSDVLKGGGFSKLAQVIKRGGYNEFDKLEVAEVTSADPLRIRVGVDFELDPDDLLVSECLTDHTGTILRADGTRETVTYEDGLKAGDRVIVSSMDVGQLYAVLDRFR